MRRTDFIFAWDEVPIKDTDDIVKLLEKGKWPRDHCQI